VIVRPKTSKKGRRLLARREKVTMTLAVDVTDDQGRTTTWPGSCASAAYIGWCMCGAGGRERCCFAWPPMWRVGPTLAP